jgi:hypothetical protein
VRRITEIKRTLSGREARFACEVYSQTDDELVALFRLPEPRDVHGVWLPAGTITVGYFWRNRPYNLYHWMDKKGRTLAYYFNVGDVRSWGPTEFEWDDLAVDILAAPSGRTQVLDEDELPEDLLADRREYILAARDEVLRDLTALIENAEQRSASVLSATGARIR